jgi:RimJ/RimL family protein N-acetyltransferase
MTMILSTLPTSSRSPIAQEGVATWPLGGDDFDVTARWLADERNAQWLDFGGASGVLNPVSLRVMSQRAGHCVWMYGRVEGSPAGVVALGNIQRRFRTAEAWFVLGAKEHARQDLTVRALARLLEHGFTQLDLRSIHAWTVEINRGGRRVLERLGFRLAGRLRESHTIGDRPYDRLWFDLLAHEFKGYRKDDRGI